MMDNVTRRRMAAGLLAGGGLIARNARAAPTALAYADMRRDADAACVYHCDYGDAGRFSQTLTNMANHLAAVNYDPTALQLVLVAHAGGIKFFLDNLDGTQWQADKLDPDLFKRAAAIAAYGVQMWLCATTFQNNNLSPERARPAPWLRMVPSGVATVAALQGKGFAYMKIG